MHGSRSRIGVVVLMLAATVAWAEVDYYTGLAAYKRGDYETAMHDWRIVAREGMAEAQYRLARMYYHGHVEQDDEAAALWYRKAADQEHARAQNNLGLLYEQGRGVDRDPDEAAGWYRRAANKGLATAQFNLGRLHDEGLGVAADVAQAVKWYRQAADQGHVNARYRLAVMYDEGDGVPQDPERAATWYRKAAKQDHGPSQIALGRMYDEGRGVKQDPGKASKWYGRASAQGLVVDRPTPAPPPLRMEEPEVEPEPAPVEQPARTTPDPADTSVAEAAETAEPPVAAPTPEPIVPPGNPIRALAARGDAEAQYELAQRFSTGQGVPRSMSEAGRWYLEAAERGHAMAGYKVAFLYLRARITPVREYVQAHKWFTLSARRGVGDAGEWAERIAKKMSEEELELSARLVRDWQPRGEEE